MLLSFSYTGEWSPLKGSPRGWEAEVTAYESAFDAITDGWSNVDRYIRQLTKHLKAAVGKRKGRTAADRKRADIVAAVCRLLSS